MSSVVILEKLLADDTVKSKEHVIETASRHASDVDKRFEGSFDTIVREITAAWGEPEFNSHIRKESKEQTESGEEKKNLGTIVPPWCQGAPRNGGIPKALRLAHWRRPEGVSYIVLRTEMDKEKDRPLYYDLVLGARRRKPEVERSTAQLRQTKDPWQARVVGILNWLRGR
jgi:hypothetical protein